MKSKTFFKNTKKTIAVIAGLSLLLAFAQCKKDTEKDENFELACDASEYINNNLQTQLDLLSDKTTPEAMVALAEWMKGQEGVSSAVPFNDRVEYVYVDGTKGSVMVYIQPDEDDLDDSRWSLMPTGNRLQQGNVVGNHKCFIYDAFPYTSSNYNPGDTIQKRFEDRGYECAHPRSEECTIDTLKAMFQYGFVMIKTHTNSDVFATGEKVTRRKRELYRESMENDLIREANLVIKEGWLGFEHKDDFFGVTNKYIEGLQGEFDNTIVFMGACLGFPDENALLKDAFLHRHAATYFGFNNYVIPRITCRTSDWIVQKLFEGMSVGEAYNTIYYSELGNCFDFEHEGETITTCLEVAGRRDIVWYEDPNAPSVTTHEVQPGSIGTRTATVTGSVEFPDPNQPIEYERGFVYYSLPDGSDIQPEVYPGSELLNFSCTLTGLLPNTTYFVMAYSHRENNRVIYGNMVSFTTLDESGPDPGDHDYVDLGLPSGTLWATCNVGANSPEEYGDYFAWGETQPKDYYDWGNYLHGNGDLNQLTKYCSLPEYGYNGFTDNLTILLPEDDAATANWGSLWRLPTQEEWQELYQNTTHIWTTRNDVYGTLFTASNGNSFFLPAAGYRYNDIVFGTGFYGKYWSSSRSYQGYDAWELWFYFDNSYSSGIGEGNRCMGQPVRAVRFATPLPQVITSAVTSFQNNIAICGGNVVSSSGSNVTERGVCWSTSHNPTINNSHANSGSGTGLFSVNATDLSQGTTYFVRAYAINATGIAYGNEVRFMTPPSGGGPQEYVDLGLPSGTRWATCNIGADSPMDYGDFFAWGETQPKNSYNWSNYKYCNGSQNTLTKYCTNSNSGFNGFTDNLTTLLSEDDAAMVNWGTGWRMPSKEEWEELYNSTTGTWITWNGINGMLFVAANGNSLFLPATGNSLVESGSNAYYWSNYMNPDNSHFAWCFLFWSIGKTMYLDWRSYGSPVRPVRSARKN